VTIPGSLDAEGRRDALRRLATERHDVLVVGGGVVGAGTALDAVSRGLSVALVEARDFASGTSSRSSKLIHGGLRYLEMLDFRLVKEALTERGLLLERLAPHLVKPVPFLYPLTRRGWERPYVGAGMILYDTMGLGSGWSRGLPHHRHLTKRGALRAFRGLRPETLVGGVQYWDAQVDDARHTLTVVRTAAALGARVASRTQVVDLIRSGDRVTGVRLRDLETGTEIDASAGTVVNATGVWTDATQALADAPSPIHVRASKGVHLVVPRHRIQSDTGLIVKTEKSVLLVIPWGRHWLIGTTDTDWDRDLAHPAASRSDIDYLLHHVNRVLVDPITTDDVEGVYAGLRPLLSGESEATSQLSREHSVSRPRPGLVVIAGGKYTTYRVMAKDTIDAAVVDLEAAGPPGPPVPPSCTETIPLLGAAGWPAVRNAIPRMAAERGVKVSVVEHLANRYGSMLTDVLDIIDARPELAELLPSTEDYIGAEVVYAARHEAAFHVPDVLVRRTRMSFESRDRGVAAAPVVARLLAGELGWSDDQIAAEVSQYLARVEAERQSQEAPDDASADAIRRRAPELIPPVPLSAHIKEGDL
jgi:glycerol-3-phosphate dehydrogenase